MEVQQNTAIELRRLKNEMQQHESELKALQIQYEESEKQLVAQMESDGLEKLTFLIDSTAVTFTLKKDITAKMPTTIKAIGDPRLVEKLNRCTRVLRENNAADILKTSVVVSVPSDSAQEAGLIAGAVNSAVQSWSLTCGIRSDTHVMTLRKTIRELLGDANLTNEQRAEIIQVFEVEDKISIAVKE